MHSSPILCNPPSKQARHPSALDSFELFARRVKGKLLTVFLDYDGTLSPIVREPDQVREQTTNTDWMGGRKNKTIFVFSLLFDKSNLSSVYPLPRTWHTGFYFCRVFAVRGSTEGKSRRGGGGEKKKKGG